MTGIAGLLLFLWLVVALPVALADGTTTATPSASATVEPTTAPTATGEPTPVTQTTAPAPDPTTSDVASPAPTDTTTPAPTQTQTSTSTPTSDPTQTFTPPPDTGSRGVPTLVLPTPPDGTIGHSHARHRHHHIPDRERWKHWRPKTTGTWSTRILDRAARHARQQGWSTARIADQIYAPFPVMGPASWSDSWGAPRYAGGYHPHAGQDVLCRWGAPVIAVEDATVSYGYNTLGGKVAYLTRSDGSFWYYAHLSRTAGRLDGQPVAQGDIIGRCGATGDATVPHVHFGFEDANGQMLDPLHALRIMLGLAEARLYKVPRDPEPQRVPTPEPPAAAPTAWPRKPIPSEAAPATPTSGTSPEMTLATGVLVAIGVFGPVAFLYRRTRRIAPVIPSGR